MTDIASKLPVRGAAGDIIVQLVDGSITSQFLTIDSSGRIIVKTTDGSGNAITSTAGALDVSAVQAGTWNINNITGTISLPTGAATSALQTTGNASLATIAGAILGQGSTTAGETGVLGMGAVTTSAPSYTTDQTSPLSLTTAGALRVDGSAVTQPVSGTVAVTQSTSPWVENLTQVGGSSITLGQKASSASLPVVIASDQSAVPVVITSTSLGTEVNDYNTASSVAINSPSNHDYAITSGKTFKGRYIHASSEGRMKIEVQVSSDGVTFATKWVAFNSSAFPNIDIQLDNLTFSETGTGSKIRIIRTNIDTGATDLYSTISGSEI